MAAASCLLGSMCDRGARILYDRGSVCGRPLAYVMFGCEVAWRPLKLLESTTRIVVEGANSAGDRSAVSHPAVRWSLPRQHADHDGMVVRV